MIRSQKTLGDFVPWFFWVTSSLPLAVLLYIGSLTRYLADDYSTSSVLVKHGFLGAQLYWYQTWTGSYLYTFLTALIELAGVRMAPFLAVLSLLLWIILTFQVLVYLFQVMDIYIQLAWVGVLTNLIVFGAIKGFRNYEQVLFWQTGIVAYESNLIVFALFILYVLKRFYLSPEKPITKRKYIEIALAVFVLGGICETWIVMQIALFALGLFSLIIKWMPRRKQLTSVLVTGFFASWASFLLTISAPGNLGHAPHLVKLSFDSIVKSLFESFVDVSRYLMEWGKDNTAMLALLLIGGVLAGLSIHNTHDKRTNLMYLQSGLVVIIGAYMLLWSGFAPGFVVFQTRPPDRAIFTAIFIFILACTIFAVFVGQFLRPYLPKSGQPFVVVLMSLAMGLLIYWAPIRTAIALSETATAVRLYSQLWDERDAGIRQRVERGERHLIVCNFRRLRELDSLDSTLWISGDLSEDSRHWINIAAAGYYGADGISTNKSSCK